MDIERMRNKLRENPSDFLTNKQYIDKVTDHLSSGSYKPLKSDPTQSITNKLHTILKKFLEEKKIDSSLFKQLRNEFSIFGGLSSTDSRQSTTLVHLSVSSKVSTTLPWKHSTRSSPTFLLSNKPLTNNPLRLKDSSYFRSRFLSSLNSTSS